VEKLTRRQKQTVEIVRDFIAEYGFSPSLREVAARLGVTVNAAIGHLTAAERKGAISRTPGLARSLRPTPRRGG
jgi:repressor LexA